MYDKVSKMAKADACNNGDLEVVWSGLPTSKGIKQSLRYVKSQRQGKKAIMVIWKLSGVVLLLAWRAAQNHPQHCHLHSQTSEGRRLEKHTHKTVSTELTDTNTTDSFINFLDNLQGQNSNCHFEPNYTLHQ